MKNKGRNSHTFILKNKTNYQVYELTQKFKDKMNVQKFYKIFTRIIVLHL